MLETGTVEFSNQHASIRRWAVAFFAPTYLSVAMCLLPERLAKTPVPGGTWVVLLGIANTVSLWFCLREVFRIQSPIWQRAFLAIVTVLGLLVETIIDAVFVGLLAMWRYGIFEGVF